MLDPSPSRADLLCHLAAEIVARNGKKPLKVAIDGRCAAGKTNFADELGRHLSVHGYQVLRPSVDGFHHPNERRQRQGAFSAMGYYQDAFDCEKIVHCLLTPLSGEEFPVSCRLASFDYRSDVADDSRPILVERNAILLFDGIFLFRRELDAFWDYRVLLFVNYDTCLSRALPRDSANGLGTKEEMERKYALRYEPAWRIYESEEDPIARANVIIDNSDLDFPYVIKR